MKYSKGVKMNNKDVEEILRNGDMLSDFLGKSSLVFAQFILIGILIKQIDENIGLIIIYLSSALSLTSMILALISMCITEYRASKTIGLSIFALGGVVFIIGFFRINFFLMIISGIIALFGILLGRKYTEIEGNYRLSQLRQKNP